MHQRLRISGTGNVPHLLLVKEMFGNMKAGGNSMTHCSASGSLIFSDVQAVPLVVAHLTVY